MTFPYLRNLIVYTSNHNEVFSHLIQSYVDSIRQLSICCNERDYTLASQWILELKENYNYDYLKEFPDGI